MLANAAGPVMAIYLLARRLAQDGIRRHDRLVLLRGEHHQGSLQRLAGTHQLHQPRPQHLPPPRRAWREIFTGRWLAR